MLGGYGIMYGKSFLLNTRNLVRCLHSACFSCSGDFEYDYLRLAFEIVGWVDTVNTNPEDLPLGKTASIVRHIETLQFSERDALVLAEGLTEWYIGIYDLCMYSGISGRMSPISWYGDDIIVEVVS